MTIREVLNELGIDIADDSHHHATEGWVTIDCPFCSPGSRLYRLGINESYGNANCWICGSHSLWQTLSEASGRPIREIGVLLEGWKADSRLNAKLRPKKALVIPVGLGKLLPPHRKYLKKRHLDPDELESLWGLQGFGIHHRFPWRIFIPIRMGEEVVSWTTRSISNVDRYINAKPTEERISSHEVLYGAELARNGIIVVEGPADAWTIGPGAVATLGVGAGPSVLNAIANYPVRAILFDNETQAQRRARKLCRLLEVFEGETYNVKLTAKDANESLRTRRGRRELRELRSRFLEG